MMTRRARSDGSRQVAPTSGSGEGGTVAVRRPLGVIAPRGSADGLGETDVAIGDVTDVDETGGSLGPLVSVSALQPVNPSTTTVSRQGRATHLCDMAVNIGGHPTKL
jgi:hypothetical protein